MTQKRTVRQNVPMVRVVGRQEQQPVEQPKKKRASGKPLPQYWMRLVPGQTAVTFKTRQELLDDLVTTPLRENEGEVLIKGRIIRFERRTQYIVR